VSQALAALAEQLRSEDTPIAAHVIDDGLPVGAEAPDEYALVMEAVREGYLLHYGESRLLEGHDDDLGLLAGDAAAAGDAMEPAVRALLLGLGEDDRREGLRRTPKRVAKAFRDGTRGTADPPLPPSPFSRSPDFVDPSVTIVVPVLCVGNGVLPDPWLSCRRGVVLFSVHHASGEENNNAVWHLNAYGFVRISRRGVLDACDEPWDYSLENSIVGVSRVQTRW